MMRILALLLVLPACDALFLPNSTPLGPDATPPDARTQYVTAVLADEPVAYWRLGTNGDAMTTNDETGNGNVGQLLGGVKAGNETGGALVGGNDSATRFDGVDDVITAGDRLEHAGRAPFTLEAWVRPTAHGNYHGILSKSDEPAQNGGDVVKGYHLYDSFSFLGCERSDGVTKQDARTPAVALAAWAHVVCTYDGSVMRLFVDGTEQATSTGANVEIPATTKAFAIGARNGGTWLFFAGAIDEVAVYDKALPPDRIAAHRSIGLGQ